MSTSTMATAPEPLALINQTVVVDYAKKRDAVRLFQRSRLLSRPMPDAVPRLRRAIEAEDLWVINEIDPQALLLADGLGIGPARQILFFHPRLMARLLSADPSALPEAPLKFVLLEEPDTGLVLRWNDPFAAFARYCSPALADLGQELAALCETIAAALDDEGGGNGKP